MRRAGIVAVASAAVLVGAACSGGGVASTESSPRTLETLMAQSTTPATLGLSPLDPVTTVPLTTLDHLPGDDGEIVDSTIGGPTTTFDELGPLPSPEPAPIPEAFESENQIGSLEIPALSVRQSLFEGVTLTTLDAGPGHWPGTAMPGQRGNVVIAGHRTSHTAPFRDLDRLKKGDEVVLETVHGRHVYVVSKIEIVSPSALWIIDQTPAKTATLFACHPKGSTAKRIVAFLNYSPERSKPVA
jgi:sortase A